MPRITIVLNDEIAAKLRVHQSEIIKKTSATCSFSNVVNLVLGQGLKVFKS